MCGLQQDGHGQETDLRGCPVCHALHSRVPLAKLYTFTVRDDVLRELERHIYRYTELNTDKRFKSLEILELMR